ncbi:hypothetical protein GDO81_007542 [Engystomops pustulosus]|uniref:Uncharacterized protein n=1 Tax=Engystomops pustulosus TaxID=76066 RepID=A0AAV7C7S7_ENGPU|nr:hypothetical protein GDO81_007542 [Engystomops pustulosus]KAG8581069.1 hypothetical protein GDO81_007542 [Engystomops pustulosus]
MNDPRSNGNVPEQKTDSNTHFYELLEFLGASPKKDSEESSVEDIPRDKDVPLGDQNWSYPAQEPYNPNMYSYAEQYYAQYMHLSNVLERGLSGIHSELSQLSRSVLQLVYGMKECADTMGFYTTRMLAFQKEMLHSSSKTNTSLQTGVHLLQDLKAKNWDERTGCTDENKTSVFYVM